jgi:hypothetical protein
MIGFFQTGGIGDAILGTSVVRNLHDMYGEVTVFYCDHLVPQVYQGMEFVSDIVRSDISKFRDRDYISRLHPKIDFIVFNKFRKSVDGELNFFFPVKDSSVELCREYGKKYVLALSEKMGVKINSVYDISPSSLIGLFNSEDDYFSDWHRFGLNCSYDGVSIPIYEYTRQRNLSISLPERFIIFHDSRSPINGQSAYPLKAWAVDRWRELYSMVEGLGLPVIQFVSGGQKVFCDGIIPHYDVIGRDAMFQDYLYLLSRADVYIGTDSWPAHAAIFIDHPKYILLKGAVSRRWDHGGRFSKIIRIGKCQACEGPAVSSSFCLSQDKNGCMQKITAPIVYQTLLEMLHA